MKISIVIPCLNEEEFLPYLIEDIRKQSLKPFEVIVVDAGSTDKTLEIIKTDDLIKVYNRPPNIGAQRQYGGEQASGEYLFFLDADVRLETDFLEKSIKEINKRNLGIAAFRYTPYAKGENGIIKKSSLPIIFCYKFLDLLFFVFQRISPSGAGSGIFVKKEIFDNSSGFSKDLKFDDIEFIRRISRYNKFGQLRIILLVSDRRFVRYGVVRIFLSYLILSLFFVFNLFKASEMVEYKFSDYYKKK